MIWALLFACMPDDYDSADPYVPDTSVDTIDTNDTDTSGGTGLVGSWLSEGADLSDLFASDAVNLVRATATFRGNGTYTAAVLDADNNTGTFVGTYTASEATSPATISLHQTDPSEAIASGIYDVNGDVLRYEVVQTDPNYGFTPPTPQGGFGSTSGPNLDPGVNVQTYRRQ